MSVLSDISEAYRRPKTVMERQNKMISEERILIFALLFCFLTFVSRLPELAQISHIEADGKLPARVGTMFVSTVFMAPLMLYIIAALSHLVLRAFGGTGDWKQARLALMWAALVCVPLVLIGGIAKVLAPQPIFFVATALTGVVFLWQWVTCLRVVEFPGETQ